MEATTRHATAIVRTATTHIANEAHFQTYSANQDVTQKYRYEAVLDGRTSDICIALSGREWAYDDPDGLRPPQHPNCRSVIVPVIEGQTPFLRASESGATTAQNYDEWLRGQSPQRQNEILGKRKAELYRDGKLNLKQLVDKEGRSRTVKELEALKAASG
jgi:SPP1 gp7 family putative phage head morphogenesis protein